MKLSKIKVINQHLFILLLLLVILSVNNVKGESESIENNLCENIKDGQFIDNPKSCHHFYYCNNGIAIPGSCPPHLYFNPITQSCDNADDVPCENNILCNETGITFFEKYDSCTKYYMCFAGHRLIRNCSDGLHFDTNTNSCNFPHLAKCNRENCPSINDPYNIIFRPVKNNCEQ